MMFKPGPKPKDQGVGCLDCNRALLTVTHHILEVEGDWEPGIEGIESDHYEINLVCVECGGMFLIKKRPGRPLKMDRAVHSS
jgi:DNA-directed RNA polymerase subunit RPC12/RpoP